MRICFLTDNFPPENNAPASRTYDHCLRWAQHGHEITVITCFPNFPTGKVFPGYTNGLYLKERIKNITVIRVWSYMAPNSGFFKRTLDYISFALSSFCVGLFEEFDAIVATSPQFFVAIAARKLAFFKRKPWIMEVRDLWPSSIVEVGAMRKGVALKYLEWQEKICYLKAKHIVCVTNSFAKEINNKGIKANKLSVIPNGVDLIKFVPREKCDRLLNELGLKNKFIVGFIGTHGMAHGLDFIIKTTCSVNNSQIHFLFIGEGSEKLSLQKLAEDLGCANVTFLDAVSKNIIEKYLNLIDVALIPLRDKPIFETVIPSKIFESAAMQKPILLGVRGEAKILLEKYNAGLTYQPEDEHDFLRQLKVLFENKVLYKEFQKGCYELSQNYNRDKLANEMLNIITNVNRRN